MNFNFEYIKRNCKFFSYAYNIDKELEETCRYKGNIPSGRSWGFCNEKSCPILNIMKVEKEVENGN